MITNANGCNVNNNINSEDIIGSKELIELVKKQAEETVFKNLSVSSLLFSVRVLNEKSNTLDLVMLCSKKKTDDMPEMENSISILGTIGGEAVTKKEPVYVPSIKDNPGFYPRGYAISSAGFRSMLALPLYIEDFVIGAMQVYTGMEGYQFEKAEMESISEFCAIVVLMIIAEKKHRENTKLLKRLHEAEKFLQISEHAARMAHDFRNSLIQSIGGWAEHIIRIIDGHFGDALSDREKFIKIRDAALIIRKEVKKMSERLDMILNYGSAKEGLHLEEVDIFEFVQYTVAMYLQGTPNVMVLKGDTKSNRGDFEKISINIDKHQIESVLRELLENARRAVLKEGVSDKTIVCHVFEYKKDGKNSVCIEVINEGVIPKENIRHIFDPFFTDRMEQGGTGLGLPGALVKVRAHEGKIKVHSGCHEVAKGYTTFRVYIPKNLEISI